MATLGYGILTAEAAPAVARRTWPGWLVLGLVMVAVAVAAVVWPAAGATLLLGAAGAFLAVRGGVLLARAGALSELAGRARGLGMVSAVMGLAALGVAVASAEFSARVLLVGVPLALLVTAAGLLARGGVARRAGSALLVWAVSTGGLLVTSGVAQGWDRAAAVATVVAAIAVAVLAVPLLLGAANLRALGARPEPDGGRPLGCAGCACSGGGCGA